MPSDRLREATSAGRRNTRDGLDAADIVTGPRTNRGKKSYVVESESEEQESEDEDAEQDEDVPIEDQIGEPEATDDDIEPGDDESGEEDAEAEDEDEEVESNDAAADEDAEMEDESPMPPPPVVKLRGPASKPSVTITPAQSGKVKSVEAKEMEIDEEDEELSSVGTDGEDDAEGEDADEMIQDDDGDIESVLGSRASTPDPSKMTKRQLSRQNRVIEGNFLQLPMGASKSQDLHMHHPYTNDFTEPQIKKHLTAEEHAMRRAEMARRRKNLSEKRNEEEKMDTINRLLKKQAPKRRGKISQAEITANAVAGEDLSEEPEIEKANPVFVRWISDAKGCRVGVPEEWLEGPAGRVFGEMPAGRRRMVEEVEG